MQPSQHSSQSNVLSSWHFLQPEYAHLAEGSPLHVGFSYALQPLPFGAGGFGGPGGFGGAGGAGEGGGVGGSVDEILMSAHEFQT